MIKVKLLLFQMYDVKFYEIPEYKNHELVILNISEQRTKMLL